MYFDKFSHSVKEICTRTKSTCYQINCFKNKSSPLEFCGGGIYVSICSCLRFLIKFQWYHRDSELQISSAKNCTKLLHILQLSSYGAWKTIFILCIKKLVKTQEKFETGYIQYGIYVYAEYFSNGTEITHPTTPWNCIPTLTSFRDGNWKFILQSHKNLAPKNEYYTLIGT